MLLTAMALFALVHNLFITEKNLFTKQLVQKKCIGFISSTFGTVRKDGPK
jgi:hypothetical protein